jgi:peptide/nickel transport system substrate-binding protein
VRRGIERGVATQATPLARLLAGASRCRPNRCDITGITVDDTTRTVTIRLVRPSGNLLDLLSNACFAVPPGTPLGPLTTHPIPATGPYQIARYVPNKIIVFTRNRHFREWSAAAQPAGSPDRIEYRILPAGDTKYAIDEVAAGRADWADALDNAGTVLHSYPLNALQDRFSSRLRVTSTQTMYGLFLNTRLPPFNNERVRQALAYAIDRQAVADDWFAPATVTCQFLPPDYPGYRPYCPYTSRRGADTWQGSDFVRAEQLLKGQHPERTTVTVWSTLHAAPGIQHIVDALRELHYHVRFRVWPKASFDYFPYVLDSRHRVQAAFMGWLTYDASAANQFSLYRCDAFVPNGGANQNPAEFCDPSLDRVMSQAEQLQATSLAQANDLWAQVERRLVTAAPWIPLVNPSSLDVLSTRVHNFKRTPALGVLFDQMWVR